MMTGMLKAEPVQKIRIVSGTSCPDTILRICDSLYDVNLIPDFKARRLFHFFEFIRSLAADRAFEICREFIAFVYVTAYLADPFSGLLLFC